MLKRYDFAAQIKTLFCLSKWLYLYTVRVPAAYCHVAMIHFSAAFFSRFHTALPPLKEFPIESSLAWPCELLFCRSFYFLQKGHTETSD